MTRIAALYRYPVKSLLGEQLSTIDVGERGFAGDRCWAVRNASQTLNGKKHPALMSAQATLTAPVTADTPSPACTVRLPDGRSADTGDGAINTLLSDYLEERVTLWPIIDPADLDHYRRAATPGATPSEIEAGLREVFARLPEEPLPDLSTFPPELFEFDSPPGTYFDAYPLLILSQNALDSLQAAAPEQRFDVKRFRPNLLLDDIDAGGFPENEWVGRTLRIGEVELTIEMPCPRCIMTTHGFGDVPRDPRIMRTLVAHNVGNLGVYARVAKGGTLHSGADVTVLDR